MKCYTLNDTDIVTGIEGEWNNTEDLIDTASIRFYTCEQNGMVISKAAQSRYKNLFLYGYVELIPETTPGTLFPEGSYLLDIKTSEYNRDTEDDCLIVMSHNDRTLLGCLKDSVVCTTSGCVSMQDGELAFDISMPIKAEADTFDNVLVLEA